MKTYSNLISTRISKNDLNEILSAIDFIDKKLSDLVSLSKEEKASLIKMKTNTIGFVHECLQIAKKNPEVVPKNVDVPEIRKDVELVETIQQIMGPLKKLTKKLNDSTILAESEAYYPSLAIYNAAKHDGVRKNSGVNDFHEQE